MARVIYTDKRKGKKKSGLANREASKPLRRIPKSRGGGGGKKSKKAGVDVPVKNAYFKALGIDNAEHKGEQPAELKQLIENKDSNPPNREHDIPMNWFSAAGKKKIGGGAHNHGSIYQCLKDPTCKQRFIIADYGAIPQMTLNVKKPFYCGQAKANLNHFMVKAWDESVYHGWVDVTFGDMQGKELHEAGNILNTYINTLINQTTKFTVMGARRKYYVKLDAKRNSALLQIIPQEKKKPKDEDELKDLIDAKVVAEFGVKKQDVEVDAQDPTPRARIPDLSQMTVEDAQHQEEEQKEFDENESEEEEEEEEEEEHEEEEEQEEEEETEEEEEEKHEVQNNSERQQYEDDQRRIENDRQLREADDEEIKQLEEEQKEKERAKAAALKKRNKETQKQLAAQEEAERQAAQAAEKEHKEEEKKRKSEEAKKDKEAESKRQREEEKKRKEEEKKRKEEEKKHEKEAAKAEEARKLAEAAERKKAEEAHEHKRKEEEQKKLAKKPSPKKASPKKHPAEEEKLTIAEMLKAKEIELRNVKKNLKRAGNAARKVELEAEIEELKAEAHSSPSHNKKKTPVHKSPARPTEKFPPAQKKNSPAKSPRLTEEKKESKESMTHSYTYAQARSTEGLLDDVLQLYGPAQYLAKDESVRIDNYFGELSEEAGRHPMLYVLSHLGQRRAFVLLTTFSATKMEGLGPRAPPLVEIQYIGAYSAEHKDNATMAKHVLQSALPMYIENHIKDHDISGVISEPVSFTPVLPANNSKTKDRTVDLTLLPTPVMKFHRDLHLQLLIPTFEGPSDQAFFVTDLPKKGKESIATYQNKLTKRRPGNKFMDVPYFHTKPVEEKEKWHANPDVHAAQEQLKKFHVNVNETVRVKDTGIFFATFGDEKAVLAHMFKPSSK